jgi:cytochrome P450
MLNTDPPRHTRLRQLVAQSFTGRQASAVRPSAERIASRLLDGLDGASEVELVEHYAAPLPTLVLAELIGIPAEDCGNVRRWSETFVSELLLVSDSLLSATTSLLDYARELVRRKRPMRGEDLISRLISSGLSDDDLSSMVFVLLIAGQTATTQLIAKGLFLLLTHEEQLAVVRTDPARLSGAVDEVLRFEPPLLVSAFRMTTEPMMIGGTLIPAGDIVLCSLAAVNHDETRFPGAGRFDVGRQDNQHLAFGFGIHRCLGANLAKVEAEVAIGAVLRRYRRVDLAVSAQDLPWAETGIMRKLTALPVRVKSS